MNAFWGGLFIELALNAFMFAIGAFVGFALARIYPEVLK